jgi:hypothetical protein
MVVCDQEAVCPSHRRDNRRVLPAPTLPHFGQRRIRGKADDGKANRDSAFNAKTGAGNWASGDGQLPKISEPFGQQPDPWYDMHTCRATEEQVGCDNGIGCRGMVLKTAQPRVLVPSPHRPCPIRDASSVIVSSMPLSHWLTVRISGQPASTAACAAPSRTLGCSRSIAQCTTGISRRGAAFLHCRRGHQSSRREQLRCRANPNQEAKQLARPHRATRFQHLRPQLDDTSQVQHRPPSAVGYSTRILSGPTIALKSFPSGSAWALQVFVSSPLACMQKIWKHGSKLCLACSVH